MRQLRDDTHLILDGEVRVYRREGLTGKPHLTIGTGAAAGSPPPFADQDRYEPSSMDSSPIGEDDIPF